MLGPRSSAQSSQMLHRSSSPSSDQAPAVWVGGTVVVGKPGWYGGFWGGCRLRRPRAGGGSRGLMGVPAVLSGLLGTGLDFLAGRAAGVAGYFADCLVFLVG